MENGYTGKLVPQWSRIETFIYHKTDLTSSYALAVEKEKSRDVLGQNPKLVPTRADTRFLEP